jgi:hypothetical protein
LTGRVKKFEIESFLTISQFSKIAIRYLLPGRGMRRSRLKQSNQREHFYFLGHLLVGARFVEHWMFVLTPVPNFIVDRSFFGGDCKIARSRFSHGETGCLQQKSCADFMFALMANRVYPASDHIQ